MTEQTKLSILHVAAPGAIGGLEKVVHDLAIGFHHRGHIVHVAPLIGDDGDCGPFLDPLRTAGVLTHVLSVRPHSVFRERRFIRSIIDKHDIRIVHTHGYRADIVELGGSSAIGPSNGFYRACMSKMGGRTRIYEWLQMRRFRKFDAVVAVSRPIAATLEQSGVDASRIHLVPNTWGGDVQFLDRATARRTLGLPADGRIIAWVGRIIRAKGADVFLRAVSLLRDLSSHAAQYREQTRSLLARKSLQRQPVE